MKTGIIGGTGRMGRLFAKVFEKAGYEVLVSGRKTAITAAEIAKQCDIVVISVPIRETVRVINEIAPLLQPDQLLCDFTSLKVRPVEAMLKSKADVIGLHPMFGPTVKSISRQTIIVCPARAKEARVAALVKVFEAQGAICTIATAVSETATRTHGFSNELSRIRNVRKTATIIRTPDVIIQTASPRTRRFSAKP